jgi:riboflavin kinase / FMN adenylyltransferase
VWLVARQSQPSVVDAVSVSAQFVSGYQNYTAPSGGTLVAVGNFDGVHLGHRALLEYALAQARSLSLAPVAMTFDPHPAAVLSGVVPIVLTTTARKIELMLRIAPELRVIVQPFDDSFSRIEAEVFVSEILFKSLQARYVLVGKNFHFGRGRRGNHELLRDLAARLGFTAHTYELSGDAAGTFSSSRIRSELIAGRVDDVASMLGRPHAISGVVVSGDGRGRTLGFPTANLEEIAEGLPLPGVYTCTVEQLFEEQEPTRLGVGVISLGPRPTVARGHAAEVHLLDFSADLYGKHLRVHLIHRLRDIEKFASVAELRAQIEADIDQARRILTEVLPTGCANLPHPS